MIHFEAKKEKYDGNKKFVKDNRAEYMDMNKGHKLDYDRKLNEILVDKYEQA